METITNIDPLMFFDANEFPSFVDLSCRPVNFFAVQPVGDVALDFERGTKAAVEAMAYTRRVRNSACISFALASIVERGQIGQIEAAFITRIANAIMVGSMS